MGASCPHLHIHGDLEQGGSSQLHDGPEEPGATPVLTATAGGGGGGGGGEGHTHRADQGDLALRVGGEEQLIIAALLVQSLLITGEREGLRGEVVRELNPSTTWVKGQ